MDPRMQRELRLLRLHALITTPCLLVLGLSALGLLAPSLSSAQPGLVEVSFDGGIQLPFADWGEDFGELIAVSLPFQSFRVGIFAHDRLAFESAFGFSFLKQAGSSYEGTDAITMKAWVAFGGGVAFEVAEGRAFTSGIRYTLGLISVDDSARPDEFGDEAVEDVKEGTLSFMLGFAF